MEGVPGEKINPFRKFPPPPQIINGRPLRVLLALLDYSTESKLKSWQLKLGL